MNKTWTQQGLSALKSGDKERAKHFFSKALSQDKQNVKAWLGLSLVINDPHKERVCLQHVLKLEPDNRRAIKWLTRLDQESQDKSVPPQNEPIPETTQPEKQFSLKSLKQALFGEPKLPLLPIILIVLLLLTEMFLMLIRQRTGYWHDFSVGTVGSNGIANLMNSALRSNPIWFVLLMIGYMMLVTSLIRLLSYVPALISWMVIFTIHLPNVIVWSRCSLLDSFQVEAISCSTVGFIGSIIIAILMGSAFATMLWPRGTAVSDLRSQKQYKPSAWTFVAGTSWLLLLTAWLIYRIVTPAEGWLAISLDESPSPRASTNIAYDIDRQTAVLFGGATKYIGPGWNNWKAANDTWEWDGENWIEKHPQNFPSPRFSHQMAYDPIRKVSVLFGGESEHGSLGDTWEWDGDNWHMRSPSIAPSIRCCGSLFFDPQRGKVILTNGLQSPDNFMADVWEWDGNNWQYIDMPNSPPLAAAFPYAYSDKQNQAIALMQHQTWIWDAGSWNLKYQSNVPPGRSDSSMAYDPIQDHFVLFGGCDKSDPSCARDDTWIYDKDGWREVVFLQDSPYLNRHLLFYDQVRERIVIFGGSGSGELHNGMWELHLPEE